MAQMPDLCANACKSFEILTTLQTGNAELVETAVPPVAASSPRPRRNVEIGLVLGILLGIGLAFLVERLDRRLRDPDAVREIFRRPILTVIPESKELAEAARPLTPES